MFILEKAWVFCFRYISFRKIEKNSSLPIWLGSMDGRLIQVDLVSLPVAISRLGTSLNHWASIPELFTLCIVLQLCAYIHMVLSGGHCVQNTTLPIKNIAWSNASYCQRRHMVKYILLSKTTRALTHQTVKSIAWSNAPHCQKRLMVNCSPLSKAPHCQTDILSNVSHGQTSHMVKRIKLTVKASQITYHIVKSGVYGQM